MRSLNKPNPGGISSEPLQMKVTKNNDNLMILGGLAIVAYLVLAKKKK